MSDSTPPAAIEKESQLSPAAAEPGLRKGPRLPLEFAVVARYQAANGEMIRSNCKTVSVCVNGALLALNSAISVGQVLQLTNVKTSQEVQCTVRSVRQKENDNVNQVGIEFDVWTPEFWEILFPREAGDPHPNPQSNIRPAKPFFGRVGPMPENPGDEIPPDATANASLEHLPLIGKLVNPVRRNKKAMIAVGAALAAAVLWMLIRPAGQDRDPAAASTAAVPFLLPQHIAQVIPDPSGFRLAAAPDFAPEAAGLLGSLGQNVTGEIPGNFGGSGQSRAYILLKNDRSWRVVVVVDGQLRCDAQYPSVAIAARIPLAVVRRMSWSERPPVEPEGDGLLIVRSVTQKASAVVLFLQGTEVISGTPADYRGIPALQIP